MTPAGHAGAIRRSASDRQFLGNSAASHLTTFSDTHGSGHEPRKARLGRCGSPALPGSSSTLRTTSAHTQSWLTIADGVTTLGLPIWSPVHLPGMRSSRPAAQRQCDQRSATLLNEREHPYSYGVRFPRAQKTVLTPASLDNLSFQRLDLDTSSSTSSLSRQSVERMPELKKLNRHA
jgi:hypothetical protein